MRGSFLLVPFLWTSKEKGLAHEVRKTQLDARTLSKKKSTRTTEGKIPAVRQHKKQTK
jgi:hypothetical protein